MIFVTGATGFLGSYLARQLVKQGHKVRALKRRTSTFELLGNSTDKIEWVEGDLLDIDSLERALTGIEKIYHCAALVDTSQKAHSKAFRVNAEGSANLYNVALAIGVKKALHVSSTIALGMPANERLMDENYYGAPTKSLEAYFSSKRYGELEAWRAHAEGLDMVVVNPAGIVGAGRWAHEPLTAFKAVWDGLNFYTTGSNGFVDVRDLVAIMTRLMESPVSGERYIMVAENVPLKALIENIARELGRKEPKYRMTPFIASMALPYEILRCKLTGTRPRFTADDLRIASIQFNYNNAKILAAGYKFRPFAETLHDTAMAFKQSMQAGKPYAIFE